MPLKPGSNAGKIIHKSLTLFLALAMLMPGTSWAFQVPAINLPAGRMVRLAGLNQPMVLPKGVGTIERVHQGQGPIVICLEDLHCHSQVQHNISRLIDFFHQEHGLSLVLEEGAVGHVAVEKLALFPFSKIRKAIADHFLNAGKLTGAEYFAITHPNEIQLSGLEDPKRYAVSLAQAKALLSSEYQGYVFDLRDKLDELKAKHDNPDLLMLEKKRQNYRSGKLSLDAYVAHLLKQARRAGVDLGLYPELVQFYQARSKSKVPEVDPEKLFAQAGHLDRTIRRAYYRNSLEQQLDEAGGRLDIIEKLINISATPEELADFLAHREQYSMRSFIDVIQSVGAKSAGAYGHTPLQMNFDFVALDKALDQVERFYQLADQRSQGFAGIMAKQLLSMKKQSKGPAIGLMVTGGYHTGQVFKRLAD